MLHCCETPAWRKDFQVQLVIMARSSLHYKIHLDLFSAASVHGYTDLPSPGHEIRDGLPQPCCLRDNVQLRNKLKRPQRVISALMTGILNNHRTFVKTRKLQLSGLHSANRGLLDAQRPWHFRMGLPGSLHGWQFLSVLNPATFEQLSGRLVPLNVASVAGFSQVPPVTSCWALSSRLTLVTLTVIAFLCFAL